MIGSAVFLGCMLRRPRDVAAAGEQPSDVNILVEAFPMQADATQFDLFAFGSR